MKDDLWLEPWMALLKERALSGSILELGCDTGRDTQILVNQDFQVIATEISESALAKAKISVPEATFIHHDLKDAFPFKDGEFNAVIASLSLHYFEWQKTKEIVSEIRRCLADNGILICRLNSVKDKNHGSAGFEEIQPNYYKANGRYSELKRFFDEQSINELFKNGWKFYSCEEMTIDRYERPKVVWELILLKKNA